ncbi:atlastin-3-like [Syngnathus typhle]|uniref:atlastin-3-like n=1 Tax=Syngnathus typhle TaxID=161592 RepID=UPI002A6A0380|nr:atlastin-3-like [Syngnathus typhle]
MGGQEFCDRYQEQLEKELVEMWESFTKHNESKNLFSAFRTPAVLFVLVCLLYELSGVLLFVGLSTFALVCDCVLGLVMMSMLTWAFIRYSGRYRDVGGAIDLAAGTVLEQATVVLNKSREQRLSNVKRGPARLLVISTPRKSTADTEPHSALSLRPHPPSISSPLTLSL